MQALPSMCHPLCLCSTWFQDAKGNGCQIHIRAAPTSHCLTDNNNIPISHKNIWLMLHFCVYNHELHDCVFLWKKPCDFSSSVGWFHEQVVQEKIISKFWSSSKPFAFDSYDMIPLWGYKFSEHTFSRKNSFCWVAGDVKI